MSVFDRKDKIYYFRYDIIKMRGLKITQNTAATTTKKITKTTYVSLFVILNLKEKELL